jgi:hypothetical protein
MYQKDNHGPCCSSLGIELTIVPAFYLSFFDRGAIRNAQCRGKTFQAFMLLFVHYSALTFVSKERIQSLLETVPFNPSGLRKLMEAAFMKVRDTLCKTPYNAPGRGLPSVVNGLPPVASREQHEVNTISQESPHSDFWDAIPRIQSQRKDSVTRGNASTIPRTEVNDPTRKMKMLWPKEDEACLIHYMAQPENVECFRVEFAWTKVQEDNKQLQKYDIDRIKNKWTYLESQYPELKLNREKWKKQSKRKESAR